MIGAGIHLSTRTPLERGLIAAIADQLPVGIFVATAPSGSFVYANDAFREILGVAPSPEAQAGTVWQLPFARALRERTSVTVDDLVILRADGEKGYVRAFARPLMDLDGVITHIVIAFLDITEEIRTRSRADLAEGRLQHLLAHAPIILFAFDRNGIVTLTEGRGLASLGFQPKELLGRSVFDLYTNEPRFLSHARRVLAGEEFSDVTQLGAVVLETAFSPVRSATGEVEGAIGVSIDVTERARAQNRLVQTERLASMGTLSATVAHEINNPLTYILGSLELAATRLSATGAALPLSRELAAHLEDAREGADRVRRIVRGLQAFARQDDDRTEPTDAVAVLERAIEMTDNAVRHHARVVRDLTGVPRVLANDLRLGQVFVNLLMNASQAMPEGHADANEIRVRSSHDAAKGEVVISVEDTGSGIAPDVQAHIFEPFFTTKPLGVGNGLGLSICHGIVEGFGGSIDVESKEGQGTAFRVRLRASVTPAPSAAANGTTPTDAPLRRGRVLIVDDDKKVARSLALLLHTDHDVEVSTEPRAVAERIIAGERFDVVLCDLMMPMMTGMDLHALVAERAPEQAERFVFVTGGAFTPAAEAFVQRVANVVLQKPYELKRLKAAIELHLNR